MPYYKNIGLCDVTYQGVTVAPGKVAKFRNYVMNDNLIQCGKPDEKIVKPFPTTGKRSSRKTQAAEKLGKKVTDEVVKNVSVKASDPVAPNKEDSDCKIKDEKEKEEPKSSDQR